MRRRRESAGLAALHSTENPVPALMRKTAPLERFELPILGSHRRLAKLGHQEGHGVISSVWVSESIVKIEIHLREPGHDCAHYRPPYDVEIVDSR